MKHTYNIEWLKEKYDTEASLKYLFFWGHSKKKNQEVGNFCFSQWFESPFEIEGIIYKTTEHWMMAQKALLFDNLAIFQKIIDCEKPGEAKELGRQVIGFDETIWRKHRFEIVKLGNIHKFNQNREFGEYLLKTGERVLVESSPVDTIWGIGLSKDSLDIKNIYTWRGLNLLGFALMETRDFLKEFGFFNSSNIELCSPWRKHPKTDSSDLFWKMGPGEQYLIKFQADFNKLTSQEKTIYKLSNPESYNWKGFYE